MKVMVFSDETQNSIFRLLSALLHIGIHLLALLLLTSGNVSFQKDAKKNGAALIGNKDGILSEILTLI